MDDYNAAAARQRELAKQMSSSVFPPLQQKTCNPGAQALLDNYIAHLRRLVELRSRAYPCEDGTGRNQPIPGALPEKILGEAQDLRSLCAAYLNAAPKAAERRPPDGGRGSCSDITGLGGPRIACPERKLGGASTPPPAPRPQARPAAAGSSNTQQQAAINNALNQLGVLARDVPAPQPPGPQAAPAARTAGPGAISQPDAARSGPLAPKAKPEDLQRAAAAHCQKHAKRTPEERRCLLMEEARLIMDSDPAIKAGCAGQRDETARSNCALQAYANLVHGQRPEENNCYWNERGEACIRGAAARVPRIDPPGETLRERLRKRLEKSRADANDLRPVTDKEVDDAVREALSRGASPDAVPQAQHGSDDPLQNFLNSRYADSDGDHGGNLGGPGPSPADANAPSFQERFGIDPKSITDPAPRSEETLFDRVRGQHEKQQEKGNVGR